MVQPAPKPQPPKPAKPLISAQGYIIAVLRAREAQRPREEKLLERVRPEEREKAREMLAKLGG